MRVLPERSTRAEVEVVDPEVCLHQDMEEVVEEEEMDTEDQELLIDTEMIIEMIIGAEVVVVIEEVPHHPGEVEEVEMTDTEVILEVTEEVV